MLEIDSAILDDGWSSKIANADDFAEWIVKHCVKKDQCEISVVFANDKIIRELNKKHRSKDKATNVLSFNYSNAMVPNLLIGEVVLSLETISKEAIELNYEFNFYTAWMIVHGILHILGYTHDEEENAVIMEKEEDRLLAALDIKQ